MLAFREKARPKMNIEVKDKKDFVNIAKKFNIAERHVTKIQDQKLLNMVINRKLDYNKAHRIFLDWGYFGQVSPFARFTQNFGFEVRHT